MRARARRVNEVGTEIHFAKDVIIKPSKTVFSALTFIGEKIPETPGILYEISKILAKNKISIHSMTISEDLIAIYLAKEKAGFAYQLLVPLLKRIKNL